MHVGCRYFECLARFPITINKLFDAQTTYSRSRYDYILNVLNLQLATGTLDRADLEKINAFLKERAITR